jgi:hypothetical protein
MAEDRRNPLLKLAAERGDEMSPALKALTFLLRFWLGLFKALGTLGAIGLGLWACMQAVLNGSSGAVAYFVVAMPLTVAAVLGVERATGFAARKIAEALRVRLDGIGGATTTASFSLGPRRADEPGEERATD